MKKVEFKLPSTAWGFPIASARFFTIHYSLFIKRGKLTRLWLVRHFQNLSRITRMRRICSFTDFYCVVGFLCACGALGLSRITSCRRNPAPYRRKYNPKEILYNIQDQIKEIRERTNPSHRCYPWTLWARADWAAGEGAQQCGTVFQTTLFSLVINPETFSRVTLALLGIVFQTKQFTTDTHLCFSHFYQLLIHIIYTDALFCYLWLPWSVAIRFGWKPIPSRARVTRDAVSGL